MSWNQWYRATSYVKSALWVAPCVAMLFEQVAIRLLHFLDARLGWTLLGLGVAEAQAMLQAIITMTLSFIVFTFASLLVAVQRDGWTARRTNSSCSWPRCSALPVSRCFYI